MFCQIRPPATAFDTFGKFFWWVVVYELAIIVFVSWTIIQDVKNQYATAVGCAHPKCIPKTKQSQVIGYLAVGTALAQLSVNSFISSTQPERIANSVGFIILSIVGVCLISQPCNSAINECVSFSGYSFSVRPTQLKSFLYQKTHATQPDKVDQ